MKVVAKIPPCLFSSPSDGGASVLFIVRIDHSYISPHSGWIGSDQVDVNVLRQSELFLLALESCIPAVVSGKGVQQGVIAATIVMAHADVCTQGRLELAALMS